VVTASYCLKNVYQSVHVSLKMCIHFVGTPVYIYIYHVENMYKPIFISCCLFHRSVCNLLCTASNVKILEEEKVVVA
jgi:hypothetical protein